MIFNKNSVHTLNSEIRVLSVLISEKWLTYSSVKELMTTGSSTFPKKIRPSDVANVFDALMMKWFDLNLKATS